MNLNILTYCIYGIFSVVITVYVGQLFHKNGYYYILSIFGDEYISKAINNVLLIGYYLVNIGFAIYKISLWQQVNTYELLIEDISKNIAIICIVLGLLNFINIGVLAILRQHSKRKTTFNQN